MSAIDYKRSFHDAVRCLCEVAKALGIPEDEAAKLAGPDKLMARVRELREMAASDAEVATKYQAAATAIRASLSQFCDESLPYDRMIVDAAQKAAEALAKPSCLPAFDIPPHALFYTFDLPAVDAPRDEFGAQANSSGQRVFVINWDVGYHDATWLAWQPSASVMRTAPKE